MRIFVIKQDTDLKGIGEALLKKNDAPARASLDRILTLNPHLDENRVAAGTVVLLPDTPEFAAGSTDTVAASSFEGFQRDMATSFRAADVQLREGLARRDEQDKEVAKAIKSAAITRLAADDAELRGHLEGVGKQADARAKQSKQAAGELAALEKALAAEMKKLGGLAGI